MNGSGVGAGGVSGAAGGGGGGGGAIGAAPQHSFEETIHRVSAL